MVIQVFECLLIYIIAQNTMQMDSDIKNLVTWTTVWGKADDMYNSFLFFFSLYFCYLLKCTKVWGKTDDMYKFFLFFSFAIYWNVPVDVKTKIDIMTILLTGCQKMWQTDWYLGINGLNIAYAIWFLSKYKFRSIIKL